MRTSKLLIGIIVSLTLIGALLIGYFLFRLAKTPRLNRAGEGQTPAATCLQKSLQKAMADESMPDILKKGQSYQVQLGYYECHPVLREDLVWFRISEPVEPVVRLVAGLPGDQFALHLYSNSPKRWQIKINGHVLRFHQGPYFIESPGVPPLKTYELSRQGRLAENEYLVFSQTAPGLTDSSNLGIVKKESFIGKVIINNN